jgi:type IV fimbrial biogenesis protein FimT
VLRHGTSVTYFRPAAPRMPVIADRWPPIAPLCARRRRQGTMAPETAQKGKAAMLQRGFNLIEMMITLLVVSVVIVMGAPSMADFINDMRVSAATNDMLSFFNYARSEAAKRGQRVTVCLSSDLSTCSTLGTNWAEGAVAFVDSDSNNQVSTGETVLRVMNPNSGVTIYAKTSAGFPSDYYFYYRPSGAANSAGTLEVCHSGRKKREVSINAVGRPMSQVMTTVCP